MHPGIHKFQLNNHRLLLDINSGSLHVLDEMTDAVLDIFDGTNKQEVFAALAASYSAEELSGAVAELEGLIERGLLFAALPDVPPTFSGAPIVKAICLHVAHDCNLRCGYCFAGTGDFGHERGMMSIETAIQAVEYLIEHSGTRRHCEIDFFGGEPLLNMSVLREATSYIRRRERETGKIFKLTLTTNAMLLDDANIAFLNDNNISLVLSLDGREAVHDRMRPDAGGNPTYKRILRNIRRAVDARNGEDYYLRGTFTALNCDFAADVAAMADEGFKLLSMEPVVGKDAEYVITEAHLPKLFAEYEKLAADYLRRKRLDKDFEFFHFNMDVHNGPCLTKRLSGCGAGHEYLAVTPEGDLYPCHQFVGREEFRLGDVWAGIARTDIPPKFRGNHVLNKEACRECWARFHCSGGCHANAELINGSIDKPYEIGCELQKKRLECALMIQADLALAD